jgi:hypothetical protein
MMKCLLPVILFPLAAFSQPAELTPAWDLRKTLDELKSHTARLTPMLQEVKPGEWVAKGAPETYVDQWQAIVDEAGYLVRTADKLAANPATASVTLETYLRLQAMEAMLDSLSQGVRRYQNPALADLLQGMVAENNTNRSRLRDYLVELVAAKEEEFRIVDQEAQRCRAALIRQPPKKAGTEKQ